MESNSHIPIKRSRSSDSFYPQEQDGNQFKRGARGQDRGRERERCSPALPVPRVSFHTLVLL